MNIFKIALFCMMGLAHAGAPIPPNTGVCMDPEEAELIRLVNEYRVANGKPAVANNFWLASTGQWHVWDRIANPSAVGGSCNTHSWSNNPPPGVTWQGMCYTPDHAQAAQMWGKPGQISAGAYVGHGFENAADCGCTMTAQQALLQWQGSPSHNNVILNLGTWSGVNFTGVGAGIENGVAVLWFGDGSVSGTMQACPTDPIFTNGFET